MCAVTLLKTLDNEGQFTESLDCSLDHKDNLPPRDGRLCGPPGGAGVSSLDCKQTIQAFQSQCFDFAVTF